MSAVEESKLIAPRPLVYVIAPYSAPIRARVMANIAHAIRVGDAINRTGLAWAVVPHQCGRDMEDSLTPAEWYAMTRDLMRVCAGAWEACGMNVSDGCRGEVADCYERGIPVAYGHVDNLHTFLSALRGGAR